MPGMVMSFSIALVKRNNAFIIFSFIIMAVGIFFLVYGAVEYETRSTKETKEIKVGVVVDAGGSGTRLIIYQYKDEQMRQLQSLICEDNGLGTYSASEYPNVKNSLINCFKNAAKNLPINKVVPLYLGATAGMRLVKERNETVYNNIWKLVRDALQQSDFKIMKSDTITGYEEGKYAWIAANFLRNSLTTSNKFGVIDFGSSSIQIAFSTIKNLDGKTDVSKFNLDGSTMTVYSHSYLCYGKREMERRFIAKLITDAGFATTVENPCYFKGYEKNYSSSFAWEAPCSSGEYARNVLGQEYLGPVNNKSVTYLLKGTGNYSLCSKFLNDLIRLNCTKTSCGMNNVFQPGPEGKFLALPVFKYAVDFMQLSSTASSSEFFQAVKKSCETPWDKIKLLNIPTTPVKYRPSRCFDSAYSYFLLTQGFKFNKNNWGLEFIDKINGAKAQWALGLMYAKKDSMYQTAKAYFIETITRKPGLIGLMVLGIIFMIGGIVLMVFTCKARKKIGKSPVPVNAQGL